MTSDCHALFGLVLGFCIVLQAQLSNNRIQLDELFSELTLICVVVLNIFLWCFGTSTYQRHQYNHIRLQNQHPCFTGGANAALKMLCPLLPSEESIVIFPLLLILPCGLLKDLPDTLLCHGAALDVLDGPQFPRHRLPLLVPHRGLILCL